MANNNALDIAGILKLSKKNDVKIKFFIDIHLNVM